MSTRDEHAEFSLPEYQPYPPLGHMPTERDLDAARVLLTEDRHVRTFDEARKQGLHVYAHAYALMAVGMWRAEWDTEQRGMFN